MSYSEENTVDLEREYDREQRAEPPTAVVRMDWTTIPNRSQGHHVLNRRYERVWVIFCCQHLRCQMFRPLLFLHDYCWEEGGSTIHARQAWTHHHCSRSANELWEFKEMPETNSVSLSDTFGLEQQVAPKVFNIGRLVIAKQLQSVKMLATLKSEAPLMTVNAGNASQHKVLFEGNPKNSKRN